MHKKIMLNYVLIFFHKSMQVYELLNIFQVF